MPPIGAATAAALDCRLHRIVKINGKIPGHLSIFIVYDNQLILAPA